MYQYIDELTQKNDLDWLRKEETLLHSILYNYKVQLSEIINNNENTIIHNKTEIEKKINDTLGKLAYLKEAKAKVFEILHTTSCV